MSMEGKEAIMEEVLDISKEEEAKDDEYDATLLDLPKEKTIVNDTTIYYYKGFWVPDFLFRGLVTCQKKFVARDDDIVLTSCPKSGTTWLKALLYSIVNRTRFGLNDSPLLKANPHELVPFLELETNYVTKLQSENSELISQPRVFNSHMSYESLPPSIITSHCKIIYICRNPIDQFISLWHFAAKLHGENVEAHHLEECFDMFCRGVHAYGPFWEHVLGFRKASLERPHKILFLKYEEMKKDTIFNIKRLAEFLGFPFSEEEEKQGVIEEISTLCSLGNLKNLEVNKKGRRSYGIPYSAFFRKGEVGDGKNYLTPSMIERMEKLMQEKYGEYNLTFEL